MSSEGLDRAKKTRGAIRGSTTKLLKKIEEELNSENVNVNVLEEFLNQLTAKERALAEKDKEVLDLIDVGELEKDVETTQEMCDNIIMWKTRINRKISNNSETRNSSVVAVPEQRIHQPSVNLPKLNLDKFSGEICKWQSFWSHYEIAVHENTQLAKPEKFAYLKSYLEGSAANAIRGLPLSEMNYDSAIKILKERFGRKDLVINSHMQNLLKLNQVRKSSDTNSLRRLYDACETEVRNLEALGVKTDTYGNLLCPILMQLLPEELTLEFSRKKDSDSEWNVEELLKFFCRELESRERAAVVVKANVYKETEREERQSKRDNQYFTRREVKPPTPTATALNTINQSKNCLFCNKNDHILDNCQELTIPEKRDVLKRNTLCFVCLGYRHMAKFCRSRYRCTLCGKKHHRTLCPNSSDQTGNSVTSTDTVVSAAASAKEPGEKQTIILQTVKTIATSSKGEQVIRALLDGGSQRTFICESISRNLNLPVIAEEDLTIYTFGEQTPKRVKRKRVKVTLKSINNPSTLIEIEALETPTITSSVIQLPNEIVNKLLHTNNIVLSDAPTEFTENTNLNLLIGSDYYWRVVSGEIKRIDKTLVAMDTIFGWTLQGPTPVHSYNLACTEVLVNKITTTEETLLSNNLRQFWELESLGIRDETEPVIHNEATDKFDETLRFKNGRYEVGLLWKSNKPELSDNYVIAENRLKQLRNKFKRNPEFYLQYNEIMQEQLKEGILEEVPLESGKNAVSNQVVYYLPHHAVVRKDKETSKVRIVYDASSHAKGEASLNDCLHSGPNLMPDLLAILLRFRIHKIAFVADITKAFLQISLREQDRDAVRLLWFKEPPLSSQNEPELCILRHTRVLFGATSSPYLLMATIKRHLEKYKETDPISFQLLNEDLYMDDLITGTDDVTKAVEIKKRTKSILAEAGMELCKWRSNFSEIAGGNDKNTAESELIKEGNCSSKILGLSWRTEKDKLFYSLNALLEFLTKRENTKRFILKTAARIFDPLGLLSPFSIRIKILFQELWVKGIDWDQSVPEDVQKTWNQWCSELPTLQEISIPRCYFHVSRNDTNQPLQLHLFSDASEKAYGGVGYLRYAVSDQEHVCSLVCAKNRVAPIKKISIPRLELMGALLTARLARFILKTIPQIDLVFLWTDSEIVLHWIKGDVSRWKPFVNNRVREIRELTDPAQWRHCSGSHNPADVITRGESATSLKNHTSWWNGPGWLSEEEENWPDKNKEMIFINIDVATASEMLVIENQTSQNILKPVFELEKYEKFVKVIRITTWIFRFVNNCRQKEKNVTKFLTADELQFAQDYWVRVTQFRHFSDEINSLRTQQTVNPTSKLKNLHPYLDQNGIIRLRGRLQKADLILERREPVLLPSKDRLTEILVNYYHKKQMHSGLRDTLVEVRETFWILQARKTVKSVIDKCLYCRRLTVKPSTEIMAPLPRDRITETQPFETLGVDFFGPLYVKTDHESEKVYVLILTCAVTRAIHLELLPDMTTNSFLLAFRKFVGRRGICKIVYSDNAKTFKSADKELQKLWKNLESHELQDYFGQHKIQWKFICERAPWWGAFGKE